VRKTLNVLNSLTSSFEDFRRRSHFNQPLQPNPDLLLKIPLPSHVMNYELNSYRLCTSHVLFNTMYLLNYILHSLNGLCSWGYLLLVLLNILFIKRKTCLHLKALVNTKRSLEQNFYISRGLTL
jgi:hypothetical protein